MPIPITIQDFSSDLAAAKKFIQAAAQESDPERQRNYALLAQASAQIANAEANWLTYTK